MQGWAHILLPKAHKAHIEGCVNGANPESGDATVDIAEEASDALVPTTEENAPATPEGTTLTMGKDGAASGSDNDSGDDVNVLVEGATTWSPGDVRPLAVSAPQELGSSGAKTEDDLPSAGSSMHRSGDCRPCAWFYKPQGCSNGKDCKHCHLCPEGEIKSRKKVKVASLRTTSESKLEQVCETPPSSSSSKHIPMPPGLKSADEATPSTLPSVGSRYHDTGECRPCAWFFKPQGCENGKDCRHCHLCPSGEIKSRKRVIAGGARKEGKQASGQPFELQRFPWQPIPMPIPADHLDINCGLLSPMGLSSALPALPIPMPMPQPMLLPSVGSSGHGTGLCRPCAWFWKPQGCVNGQECLHCHLCPDGELKVRKKVKVAGMRTGDSNARVGEEELSSGDVFADRQPRTVRSISSPAGTLLGDYPVAVGITEADAGDMSPAPADAMPMSVPWPTDLASTGSTYHALGSCKPCAWLWKPTGCLNGRACAHCHLCPAGELQVRRKAKMKALRAMKEPGNETPTGAISSPMHAFAMPLVKPATVRGSHGGGDETPVTNSRSVADRAPRIVNIASMLEP
eukprot:TRINITY_DN69830_c0_g1_i1.p1 TRINITY_DN69830_c0_g1~~TRINITY_DN69830_c0_g1_i1.p1  ORF type:complete len:572 (-),score=87.00 TRINITY_DN69830_c0_g1_i1:359-2074(-)